MINRGKHCCEILLKFVSRSDHLVAVRLTALPPEGPTCEQAIHNDKRTQALEAGKIHPLGAYFCFCSHYFVCLWSRMSAN